MSEQTSWDMMCEALGLTGASGTRWSLDRFPTFPLIGSQYGRNKQTPNGVTDGFSRAESHGLSALQSAVPQATITGVPNSLQCFRESCGSLFSDDISWREHGKTCHVLTNRYRCVFTKCTENFTPNSPDAFIRHQKTHRIWTCELEKCTFTFGTWEKALKHATKVHKFGSPEFQMKVTWVTIPPKNLKKDIRCDQNLGFDLGNVLELFEAETLRNRNSASLSPRGFGGAKANGSVPGSLPSAVFTYIAGQLNMIGSLLDHQSLAQNCSERDQIIQALDMLREKLCIREKQEIRSGWHTTFGFKAGSEPGQHTTSRVPPVFNGPGSRSETTIPQSRNISSTPLSNEVSPTYESGEHLLSNIESESEDDSYEDLDESKRDLNIIPATEPQQEAHLEKSKQIQYFEAMQKCCIEAAFTFYQRHKPHLDTINDRSSKPLCITAKRERINSPTDLSLPHWTHLLRRISDARGLQKEMVSRIESFNGDILPVDEIQHAFKKGKVKSDRDLLALIQLTRNFCWQLKDWDKCKDLDELYGLVEKNIKASKSLKRKDSQQSRKQHPRYFSPKISDNDCIRNGQRQSATWPRLPPGTEDEAYA